MELDEAKKILGECARTKSDLEVAFSYVQNSQIRAKSRLAELKNELPKVLAALALGGEGEGEVKRIKTEMAEIKEILADAPLTLEELTRMQAANAERIKEAQGVILKSDLLLQYEALQKEILANTYSEGEIEKKLIDLKAIANAIDHYGSIQRDYEGFVEQIQGLYKTYRIAR